MHDFSVTASHGIPIPGVGNSVTSTEGVFHGPSEGNQAQSMCSNGFASWTEPCNLLLFKLGVPCSWPVTINYMWGVSETGYAKKEQRLLEINGIQCVL